MAPGRSHVPLGRQAGRGAGVSVSRKGVRKNHRTEKAGERRPIITLLTDFGHQDPFVGIMKGVILGLCPTAALVDLCHETAAYDVLGGSFLLHSAVRFFPAGTIHVAVVDPGVGTERRPILAAGDNHYFIAPDNGVLSFVYPQQERLTVREIKSEHYFRSPVSQTFHARDIFAPVAAYLSKGLEPYQLGEEITDYVRLQIPKPQAVGAKSFRGVVLKVDRFGNAITNLGRSDVPALFAAPTPGFKLKVGDREITRLLHAYAEGAPEEMFAILGSSGYLEIAANRGGAAKLLGITRGAEILLEIS